MTDKKELFESTPVPKSVISLVIPTVISQLITVVYNMADTFFIGQIGDPNQVAAVSLCMPLFILLTGMANLFGIGGASLISRSLGEGNPGKAKAVSAFCIWSAGAAALVYGIAVYILRGSILPLVGANEGTYDYCSKYLFWAVTVGAVPTVMSAAFSHLVRSEGCSKEASFGIAMGGVLNIFLDPVFIFVFKLQVAGAAVATMLSNLAATVYFIVLIIRRRKTTVILPNPKYYTLKMHIPSEVLLVGLPSCMMNLMGVASNIVMNRLMVSYCNEAVAGIGIAKKIDMLAYAIATGMSQGVLPLIGYNYSAKNYKRMMSAVRWTFIYSISVAVAGMVFLLTCARPIVRAFIQDPATVSYGSTFQRIICLSTPCVSITMIIITLFQSVGKKGKPLFLSMLRKGLLDIPAMLLLNHLIGVNGIATATPVADFLAMVISICLFIPFWRSLKAELYSEKSADS